MKTEFSLNLKIEKAVVQILFIILCTTSALFLFQNCAPPEGGTANANGDINSPYVRGSITVEHNGQTVGYIYTFGTDNVGIYLSSEDIYTWVNIKTGKYVEAAGYYSGPDCTGALLYISPTGGGESHKIVGRIGDRYYRIKEPYVYRPTAKYQSVLYPQEWYPYGSPTDTCISQSNPVQWAGGIAYTFEEVSRPYDFESIAPLKIKFR